ncbi:hypothetical protein CMK22_10865 [Candidatus Poribacteria bacterium]|nr:hypothetical protein [Candidatus Poribacteria bacterium]
MMIRFLRLLFLLVGIWILILTIPLSSPSSLTNIITSGGINHQVTINTPILNSSLIVSGTQMFFCMLLFSICLVCVSPSGRRNFFGIIHSPKRSISILLPLTIFIFALYPTQNGLPIVLYLTLSTLGLLSILFGAYPVISYLRRWLPEKHFSIVIYAFINIRSAYFLTLIFAITFTLTNLCSYFIFEHVPHVQDNIDQLFHAKIFLSGHLTVPSHEHKEFFDFTHNINNGKWYSEYPPGHTLMLMLGLILNAPWIINPFLGSVSVVLFYLIGKSLFDETTGRLASLLGGFSPFVIIMSSGFFSHNTSLFFTALFALFFFRTIRTSKFSDSLIAGLSLGICLNARILTAIGIGLPYAFYAVYLMLTKTRVYILCFMVMLAGFLMMVGVLASFNYLTNGHPMLTGYEVLWGSDHNPGFGHSAWGEPHTPKRGLIQNLNNLNALNKYLFEWCIPSTFFVMLFFAGGRRTQWDYLLIASVFSLSFVYFFYWYQGWCFGPRFMYESTCPLILLTARGIIHTPDIIKKKFQPKLSEGDLRYFLSLIIGFCVCVALYVNVPTLIKLYSDDYWGVNTKVQKAVEREKISNAVVFVNSYYGSVLALNSPQLDSKIIYVRDLGVKNKLMMDFYPERKYYLASGSNIQKIFSFYYDGTGEPAVTNGDFEMGTLDGWQIDGHAWGITGRDREGRIGNFHAESLVGGEETTGIMKSDMFTVTGEAIGISINGWDRDPLRPNQCLLKDFLTNEILRTASPPNQDAFVTKFWDVSDLVGRKVYLTIVDNDDDTLKKGGFAWIGLSAIYQLE